jgi:hypothetical protein
MIMQCCQCLQAINKGQELGTWRWRTIDAHEDFKGTATH